jgi:hypothetical protein
MTQETTQEMTLNEAREWLRLAVEERGSDFVYYPDVLREREEDAPNVGPRCYYVPRVDLPASDPRSQTGCIAGTVMRLAGREITEMHEGLAVVDLQADWNLSYHAALYLTYAQRMQDGSATWGEARDQAERAMSLEINKSA